MLRAHDGPPHLAALSSGSLLLRDPLLPDLADLLVRDLARCAGERVVPRLIRECDDLADVVLTREQHHDPVDARRDTPVRRHAVAERAQQEPELLLGLFRADPELLQHASLDLRIVDPDAPAP